MAGPVLESCPQCRYALSGLPAEYRCPECGLRYDAACMRLRASNVRKSSVRRVVFYACLSLGPLFQLRHLPWITTRASWFQIASTVVGFVGAILLPIAIWKFVRYVRRGIDVAIVTDGVCLRIPDHREELIPWRDVRGARIEPPRGDRNSWSVHLLCEGRETPIAIGGDVHLFPEKSDARRFLEEVNRRKEMESGDT